MAGRRKRILIIAYAFPPNSAVGGMRPLRICKYLARGGQWEPTVLTVSRSPLREDAALLADLPAEVRVVRTATREPYYALHPLRAHEGAPPAPAPSSAALAAPVAGRPAGPPTGRPGPRPVSGTGHWRRLLRNGRYWLEEPITTPDPQVFWNCSLVPRGLSLIREIDAQVVLVTGPPWSSFIGGAWLARLTGRPLVLDFRDPWIDIERGPRSPWRKAFERWCERRLCEAASTVISTSATYTQEFRRKYPRLPAERFFTLLNGYDEDAFARAPSGTPPDTGITVVHLGSVYSGREPTAFFAGAARWLAANPGLRSSFRLVFVGQIGADTWRILAEHGLDDRVQITGFVSHWEAIQRCRQADLLLLAMGSGPATPHGWLPSKLFEYLACHRPILAHTVDGEAAALIRKAGAGHPVTNNDPDAFAHQLTSYHEAKLAAGRAPAHANHQQAIAALRQSRLVQQLSERLHEITSRMA